MGKFFTLIIIFVLSSNLTIAQQNITEHTIKKGESVYSISKDYGVSMNAIFNLNPRSKDIIYAGRILKIPTADANNTSSDPVITDTQISNYKVKRGETKSGLARRFGVSIAMLEQQNPQIVRMLQAGHIINVDKTIQEQAPQAREGEHTVTKGETLWGIARQNGISVQLLTAANANRLSEYLQIGETLIIPDKNSELALTGEYLVKRGDTKYELAKRFNLTIAQLEAKNPQIVDLLMAGVKINVDTSIANANTTENLDNANSSNTSTTAINSDSNTNPQTNTASTFNYNPDDYEDYVIQPQETLFGLSRKAGMTIEEFTQLNPKLLTAVNKGDVIKMPIDGSQTTTTANTTSNTVSQTTVEVKANANEALYNNLNTTYTNGLYFYTPFSGNELSSPELRDELLKDNDDYKKYLEFFQGAQIAIDSALTLQLNFDIDLIKESDVEGELNIESAYQKNAMLVPFLKNGEQFPKLVSNETVSVIDIGSNLSPIENSTMYKIIPSENFQKIKTLNYIANQKAQVIVVSDLKEARNKQLILKTIPEAKFLKVDNAGVFENDALETTLKKGQLNYILLDSEKTIVFLKSTTALMNKLSDYNIQLVLIDDALIPKKDEVSDLRYRVLKLIYPTLIDAKLNKGIVDFENNYENTFNSKPSEYAILGYNITLDVLLRLSQNSSFENTIKNISSEQSHMKFDFRKTTSTNYSNTGLYLIQYDSNEGVIQLD